MIGGAIIDFHPHTPKRPGYHYLRYPCTDQGCPNVAIDPEATAHDIAHAHIGPTHI